MLPTSVFAMDVWIPSTIKISINGDISHKFPLPTSADPGNSVGSDVSAGFYPVIGGKITRFKRVFALEGERPAKKSSALVETSKGVFLPAQSLGGYRVVEQSDKSISLTLAGSVGPGGWAGLGLSVAVKLGWAKGYQINRYAKTIHHIDRLPKVEIPETIEKLKMYSPGDSLAFKKKFTVGFNAAAKAGIMAQIGVAASIATSWNVAFQIPSKRDNPKREPIVRVTYAKAKDKNIAVNVGNLISNFSIAKVWGKSQSFEYIFNLSNRNKVAKLKIKSELKKGQLKEVFLENVDVLQAYQQAIQGNLILADMLSDRKKYGVIKVSETNKQSRGKQMSAGLKIPFLFNMNFSRGKTFTTSATKKFGNDTLVENWLGVFNQQVVTSGLVSHDSKRLNMFTGNYQQITPLKKMDGNISRRYSANYKYYYARNNVSVDKMQEELRKVREKVGFMKHLKGLKIKPAGGKKVGSLEIDLDVALSNVATDELIKVAEKYGESTLTKEALSYLDGFFANVKDAKAEICTRHKTRILKECIFTTKRQTKSAMKMAYRALIKMKKHRSDVNYKEFVQAYADFGQGFIENRFTLKTFLRMLRYEFNPRAQGKAKYAKEKTITLDRKRMRVPYEIKIKIQGTHIAPFNKTLKSWK
ncbi:MAG: hypothetical protein DRQ88_06740 [Epsilonproteobacteria bacterium]|nr:MAG: hypothetical protein DRQ89_02850 [Campylobacterota bacterium]RLA66411.1 MAG: hypothetical protein DRQ88_06740 [Campylobacterota bacterium]